MAEKLQQIGRLALREEGSMWNAYYAEPDHMKGALLIGSIALAAVASNVGRKRAFMGMMRGIVSDLIKNATGHKPTWKKPRAAPEHERGGNV